VCVDDGSDGPAALSAAQTLRRYTALEFVADHAAAATDRAFDHRPTHRITQGIGHMLWIHMEAVDVAEQAVIGLQYNRHVPVADEWIAGTRSCVGVSQDAAYPIDIL